MNKKHNKFEGLVVRALSKYLSEDKVADFIETHEIEVRSFKLPNDERKYSSDLRIRYYTDKMEEGRKGCYDLFEFKAFRGTISQRFSSIEDTYINHKLTLDSRKIFESTHLHEKSKSAKEKIEKAIRRFFENQAIIFDDTRSWFDDKRIKNERKKRNLKKKDSKNDRQ